MAVMKLQSALMICLFALIAWVTSVQAAVVVNGTRVIYPADASAITVQVFNRGQSPSLVQIWIDDGDIKSTPEDSNFPFVISPALVRLNPEKIQNFRILALPTAKQLSQSQETMFWLNILDIPAKPKNNKETEGASNYMQFSIRTRIKFFYRPISIENQIVNAAEKLEWHKLDNQVVVHNPTPFNITLNAVVQKQQGRDVKQTAIAYVLQPFSEKNIQLNSNATENLFYETINDSGALIQHKLIFK